MDDWAHEVFSCGVSSFSLSLLRHVAVLLYFITVAIHRCLRSAADVSCSRPTECNYLRTGSRAVRYGPDSCAHTRVLQV